MIFVPKRNMIKLFAIGFICASSMAFGHCSSGWLYQSGDVNQAGISSAVNSARTVVASSSNNNVSPSQAQANPAASNPYRLAAQATAGQVVKATQKAK